MVPGWLGAEDRARIVGWLGTLHPLWEQRYSTLRPPPAGREQRQLLRPVYWLGAWQFACLGYYAPPRGVVDRCVQAEPHPPALRRVVAAIEAEVRARLPRALVPEGWELNTALVNFYGRRQEAMRPQAGSPGHEEMRPQAGSPDGDAERWVDAARVGEHRDFEPGPVASLSLGERALFQFVEPGGAGSGRPVQSEWLDDGALQLIAGPRWKDRLLHRVTRVERKRGELLPPAIAGFETRRVNLTFRWVPRAHITPYAALGGRARADVAPYLAELAPHAPFFAEALAAAARSQPGGHGRPRE